MLTYLRPTVRQHTAREEGMKESLSIRAIELHFLLLFLVSVGLVLWQYFGMTTHLAVLPGISSKSPATLFMDSINDGRSEARLTSSGGEVYLECQILLSHTFAFCGLDIPLVEPDEKGLDISNYSQMVIDLEYHSAEQDTLLIYLINEEQATGGERIEKTNLWAVSSRSGRSQFSVEPNRFILPSWWILLHSERGVDLEPNIKAVKSVRITTGDNVKERKVHLKIHKIDLYGKWISSEHLYVILLASWLALFLLHGIHYVHMLSVSIRRAKTSNDELMKLNSFLSIQKDQYESMAKSDSLTGALNRAGCRDLLESVLEAHQRLATSCSLIALDIDHFKQINDEFGHSAGDQVLKQLVELIDTHSPSEVSLARWGGEEFVLICPNTKLQSALFLAESLRLRIERFEFLEGRRITCSFGVAELQDEEVESWFERADRALYAAKHAGRNSVEADL